MSSPLLAARFVAERGRGARTFRLEVELTLDGGVLVLFGPSGAGKTLTLQALAGLLRPLSGQIRVGDDLLFDAAQKRNVPPHARRIGYVPQQASLFPFCDVMQNVAFGLPRAARKSQGPRVEALVEEMGLSALRHARPGALSGGEAQRVALARALAVEPRLLLLDEPFAAIDQPGRQALREALRETLRRHQTPAVFVTHDPDEALVLGDKVVCLERGRTLAAGLPASLLDRAQRALRLDGRTTIKPRPLGDGRVEIKLTETVLEGPSELLVPDAQGHLSIEAQGGKRRPPPK